MTDDQSDVSRWVEETTAFDRVQSVATALSTPASAAEVAAEAAVAENTARAHLDRLVEMNVLRSADRDGSTVYAPDPLHTRVQTLRDLLSAHDHDGLVALQAQLQERIEGWHEEFGVDDPETLRATAATTETAAETRRRREVAADWETTAHRLSVVTDAVENYETYTRDPVSAR
jgi:predicted ArsR family transcriptional regulator